MKPISEMSLRESISRLWQGLHELRNSDLEPRLSDIVEELDGVDDRIFELTRWIPVSERLPTEEDAYSDYVMTIRFSDLQLHHWEDVNKNGGFTHWKRIDMPEDV